MSQKRIEPKQAGRREFLRRTGAGFGMVALTALLDQEGLLAAPAPSNPSGAPLPPLPAYRIPATAKSVIWLFMEGAPSSIDLFDFKPEITKRDGQQAGGKIDVFFGSPGPLMKSPFAFKQYGRSGAWISAPYAALAPCIDEIAFIKSVYTASNNHAPALYQMNTGFSQPGYPAAGSWVNYGLGTQNRNLPGFIVMQNRIGTKGGPLNWSAGFLPSAYQGTTFRSEGAPVLNLNLPPDLSREQQRAQLDLMATLNGEHRRLHPAEGDLEGRIQSFELAYRMQAEAQGVIDLSQETEETRRLYGLDKTPTCSYGKKLLLARRMVEKGVRFVQAYSDNEWDAHTGLTENHTARCAETAIPVAGLLTDLKRRGMLDSTLVIWGGEFGRMPVSEKGNGRDHNPHGFTVWMAGGGIKGGAHYGATDEIGHRAVTDPVSINDLHATILHLMGIEHTQLTYRFNGRDFRLTDVAGKVLHDIIA